MSTSTKPSPMRWTKDRYGDLTSGFSYSVCEVKAGQGYEVGGFVAYFASSSLCEPTTLAKAKAAAKRHQDEAHERSEEIRRRGW